MVSYDIKPQPLVGGVLFGGSSYVLNTLGSQVNVIWSAYIQNQAFFLDHIRYTPSADITLNNNVIRVGTNDSGLQYGPGWQDDSSKAPAVVFIMQSGGDVFFWS